jgi:hypothetical protein
MHAKSYESLHAAPHEQGLIVPEKFSPIFTPDHDSGMPSEEQPKITAKP